jgi:hypothetical protein
VVLVRRIANSSRRRADARMLSSGYSGYCQLSLEVCTAERNLVRENEYLIECAPILPVHSVPALEDFGFGGQ